ncbi:ABC transporter ATP-binding protein [Pseudazoarcus pumilus]|uniref:Branched-chain amino acid ABC transporter ATP-binding protein n=1 Tax=Pseudazoarcus pumilus TaxID=2067960 RepID=A0A2I6S2U3_9RHOO|nr:ABC transporter ATP-binding protein [Pseudazoarcus pumilus]AUN93590.1 branched-chain amino acid ABC transporter ATP-binding protein [Pseudazoarcus pumilus]
MTQMLLRISDLQVAYGHVQAVRGVSIEVGDGDFVAVIGSNGAGKSSTMKALSGVVQPVAGRIEFDGEDVTGQPSHAMVRRGLAMVPEGRHVFSDQTVEDNLRVGAFVFSREPAKVEEAIEHAYELFPRLAERRAQLAGSLSGGEQQMLAIARGLASSPRLLVIDELSLGLAPKILEMLFPVLVELNKEGLAVLLVEQLANQALAVSRRAYVMENGVVSISGESRALASDPRVMEAYLGRRGH